MHVCIPQPRLVNSASRSLEHRASSSAFASERHSFECMDGAHVVHHLQKEPEHEEAGRCAGALLRR